MSHSGQPTPEATANNQQRKNDRENRIKMYRERRENEERERRLTALRLAEEREQRSRQMKEVEKARRANELRARELQRRQAFEERRRHIEEAERQKRQQLLEKVMASKASASPSAAGASAYPARPASAYAFGSSGPRTLAYLEKLDSRYRVYDSKLHGGPSQALSALRTKANGTTSTGRPKTSAALSSRTDREGSGIMTASMYQGSTRDRRVPSRLIAAPAANSVMTASFAAGETFRSSPNVRSKGSTGASARRNEANLVNASGPGAQNSGKAGTPVSSRVKQTPKPASAPTAVRKAVQEGRKRAVAAGRGERAVVSPTAGDGPCNRDHETVPGLVDKRDENFEEQSSPQEEGGITNTQVATESPVLIMVTAEPSSGERTVGEPASKDISQASESMRTPSLEDSGVETEKQQQPAFVKNEPPVVTASPNAAPYKSGSNRVLTAEEAKAALDERRRIAREQMEREKELERQREEERRRLEEERLRKEEEEFRLAEEEEARQLEIARQEERRRLQLAIELEQKRREEAAQQLAEETIKKAENELKAREQADRMEQERREMEEKRLREEKERSERRKKLEAIMQRTRASNASEVLSKTDSSSPSQNYGDNTGKMSKSMFSDSKEVSNSEASPRFLSTMLQKLADSRPSVGRSLENVLNRVRSSASVEGNSNANGGRAAGTYLEVNNGSEQKTLTKDSDDNEPKTSSADRLTTDKPLAVNGDEVSPEARYYSAMSDGPFVSFSLSGESTPVKSTTATLVSEPSLAVNSEGTVDSSADEKTETPSWPSQ